MTTPFSRSRIAAAVGMVALALGAGQVSAAGFALQENSGSGLGNAYAGGAASAEDAATLWSNVAGMSRIKTNQLVGAVNLIEPSFKFSNGTSLPAAQQPLGGNGGDAGSLNVVPNLYLVVPINKQWTFGLGVNAPFGLVDEYDNGWIGRYQALKSDIKTININPADLVAGDRQRRDRRGCELPADQGDADQQCQLFRLSRPSAGPGHRGRKASANGGSTVPRDDAGTRCQRQHQRRRQRVGLERRYPGRRRQEQPLRPRVALEHQVQQHQRQRERNPAARADFATVAGAGRTPGSRRR